MKIVDFDKLSVLNLHYCQYTLDYFPGLYAGTGNQKCRIAGRASRTLA